MIQGLLSLNPKDMVKKKKKSRKSRNRNTPLSKHKIKGKVLQTPLSQIGIKSFAYDRDLIPELLWIDSLAQTFNNTHWHKLFDDFLDALEKHFDTEKIILLGTLTDFGKIPESARETILIQEKETIKLLFENPVGQKLLMYPDCPANWLISKEFATQKIDSENIIKLLKEALIRLYPGKDEYCGYLRMMPLKRILKHGRMRFPMNMPIVDLLPKYPINCTDEEKRMIESFGRSTVNMILSNMGNDHESHISTIWTKYFWQHNFQISTCEQLTFHTSYGGNKIAPEQLNKLPDLCESISKKLSEYMTLLTQKYPYDLYEPEKDEVILGLYSRIVRFLILQLQNTSFWSIDISRIILRCIVETVINLGYLLTKNEFSLYQSFIEYGKGKEKLLMLQLQDTYENAKGPSGESFEDLQLDLGSFNAELIDINFGNWAKTDICKMSIEIGFEDLYRLIFDPTSSDVHGSWTSIRKSNLTYCANPLHRMHKLPTLIEPPFYIEHLILPLRIFERIFEKCKMIAGFPDHGIDFASFYEVYDVINDESSSDKH
jgi:hypothetical protein